MLEIYCIHKQKNKHDFQSKMISTGKSHHSIILFTIDLYSNLCELHLTYPLLLFKKKGYMAATLPQWQLLTKPLWTVEWSIWHPSEAARCWARSSRKSFWLTMQKHWEMSHQVLNNFLPFNYILLLTSADFSNLFENSLNITSRLTSLFADFLLRVPLLKKNVILCLSNWVIFGILNGMMSLKVDQASNELNSCKM